MPLPPRQFQAFLDGRGREPISVGLAPSGISAHIGSRANQVLLSREYAKKLIDKHFLKHEHFFLIQKIMDSGYAGIQRRGSEKDLVFVYFDEYSAEKIFKLVLKTNKLGDELWLKTLHRIKPAQYPKLISSLEIIYFHKK